MGGLRTAVLIDGGHTRVLARKANKLYSPDYIEKIAHACVSSDETIFRILYYDFAPYAGTVKLPVSGNSHTFSQSGAWLDLLSKKDLFAVRKGVLKFRGWIPKKIPISATALSDEDFAPDFEQKGVDMRIGLDVATYASDRIVDRLVLVSGDTDCIPAMKQARKQGVQIVLITFPNTSVSGELLCHADFRRELVWP